MLLKKAKLAEENRNTKGDTKVFIKFFEIGRIYRGKIRFLMISG
jgi:hypothetical protein